MKRFIVQIFLLTFVVTPFLLYGEDSGGAEKKNLELTPLIGPAYTPELQFLVAGGALISFSTDPSDKNLQRSSIPVTLGYSSNGSIVFNARLTSFWLQDKMRVFADINLKNMPDNYWGVGHDSAHGVDSGSDTTAYRRHWWQLRPSFYFRIRENLYSGVVLDLNSTTASDVADGILEDDYYQEFGAKNQNSGVGLLFLYDSRDFAVNPWSGIYFDLQLVNYAPYLYGDNAYQVASFDYRQYQQLFFPGSTLAWQIKTRSAMGDVPYGEMSQLGTPFDLRGYYWGKYRDNTSIYSLCEYRVQFPKADGTLSHFGGVVWGGVGSIGENYLSLSDPLWNIGVGFRYEVQKRMNVRLDFGWGYNSFGFYFNFQEAY